MKFKDIIDHLEAGNHARRAGWCAGVTVRATPHAYQMPQEQIQDTVLCFWHGGSPSFPFKLGPHDLFATDWEAVSD